MHHTALGQERSESRIEPTILDETCPQHLEISRGNQVTESEMFELWFQRHPAIVEDLAYNERNHQEIAISTDSCSRRSSNLPAPGLR
jgi:hypothetical protein